VRPKQKKVEVHLRLYAGDVRELKRRAGEMDVPWQVFLRGFLHRALKRKPTRVA
jgi:predicted DNA binding CopG/RHH family protein